MSMSIQQRVVERIRTYEVNVRDVEAQPLMEATFGHVLVRGCIAPNAVEAGLRVLYDPEILANASSACYDHLYTETQNILARAYELSVLPSEAQ